VGRVFLVLFLILGLAPGTWVRQPANVWQTSNILRFTPVKMPGRAELARHLGPFELEAAWQITSPDSRFGGFSSLLPQPGGRLMAISDRAVFLVFTPPSVSSAAEAHDANITRIPLLHDDDSDTESATEDPVSGTIWIGHEDSNAISRHDPAMHGVVEVRPSAMRDWPRNTGPEAMVRLADGRFIVLDEGFTGWFESRRHPAVLFPRDPLKRDKPMLFQFVGVPQFSITDMAQLPDGRVLILMRRLLWPLPLRFGGRIMIADPAEIRPGGVWRGIEVARLTSSLPVDNFEGLAIEPRPDGRVTVWLISDDDRAATQRTLLWKLAVDPRRLPWADGTDTRKKARN